MKTLELIVPCYNEEKTLENLIKSKIVPLREQCQKLLSISLKVIILDDASKDSSAEIANNLTT